MSSFAAKINARSLTESRQTFLVMHTAILTDLSIYLYIYIFKVAISNFISVTSAVDR